MDDGRCGFGTVARGGFLYVRGWLLATERMSSVENLKIGIAGAPMAQAFLGLHRLDVRDAYGISALAGGFFVAIPIDVPLGRHTLMIEPTAQRATTTLRITDAVTVTPPRDPLHAAVRRQEQWKFCIDGAFFRDDAPAAIDAAGTYIIPPDRPADLRLWVIDTTSLRAPRAIVARCGGRYLAVTGGLLRDDAAASLDAPNAARCGFSFPILPGPIGTEDVAIYAVSHAGEYAHITTVRVRQPNPLPSSVLPQTAAVLGGLDEIAADGVPIESRTDVSAAPMQRMRLRGWAIDAAGPRLTGGTEVLIDDALIAAAASSNPRPDIVAEFGAGLTDCEFAIEFVVPNLQPGTHALTVRVLSARRDAAAELMRAKLHV